jgi:hypothetical protein
LVFACGQQTPVAICTALASQVSAAAIAHESATPSGAMIGTKRWLASGQQREHLDKLLLRLVATRRAARPAGLGTLCDDGIGAGEFRPLGIRRVALRRKTRRRRRSCKPRQTRPGSPIIDDTSRGLAANSASQRFAKSCLGALRLLLRPLSATGRKTRAFRVSCAASWWPIGTTDCPESRHCCRRGTRAPTAPQVELAG